ADDRVERDRLQPERPFTQVAERGDDLVVGQHLGHVVGLAPQPGRELGEHLATALALEVALRVGVRVSGVDHHCRYSSIVRRPTTLTIRVSPSTRSGTGWP